MRDYLYIWHNPEQCYVVASGIETKDVIQCLGNVGGLLFLAHDCSEIQVLDFPRSFGNVPASDFEILREENVYHWGDVCWVDYATPVLPALTRQEIAELLFFRETGEVFVNTSIPCLKNKFCASGHDDGWYLRLHYDSWRAMAEFLNELQKHVPFVLPDKLLQGESVSFFITKDKTLEAEKTHDIDKIQNEFL